MLDLGQQTRHEGLESEPRSPINFSVCIPSYFSLGGAHCTASYSFLSIFIKGSLSSPLFYCSMLGNFGYFSF